MTTVLFGLSLLSLVIWAVLLFARGGFWRTRPAGPVSPPPGFAWPAVVAIVPARNEADVIGQALATLLAQQYEGEFHVIVVDDHSTDGTADAARAAALELGCPERLNVVAAEPLPPGWSGKVWAQSQGIDAAKALGLSADYFLLTDADIGHPPEAVAQLVARAAAEQRDLVSLMVRLRCDSFWEKALIPAFVFFFAKLYPFAWVNDVRNKTAGAAGGCMLVRRMALEEAGGIEAIRAELIDDCSLAARVKHRGAGRHPIRLDVADRSLSLRPYDSPREIWNMIARTAFTQLRYSPWLLAGTLAGMTIIYLVPPVVALVLGAPGWPAWLAWAAMCCAYAPMLRYYRRSLYWAPALPLVALFYVGATVASAVRYWRGKGGQWKARVQAPVQER
ncbi:glycosyltransferase [Trinickia caryophylli]|uniref:Hopene-associated glycosyltransferase HpnB n=1 Tax=Trinickia caryophylli TaxID=28094 RepID=A0A1X7G3C5_TRICW|nr:glycosyltransferase [Trinickia caryophylli]PMS13742.1 glycosyl transferase family 2 [Trinickia caryophylli]TRX14241.1 glycosyltransferase [Trinickia caryophylli]WQE14068.1 glycosyltransferase [Trinickia caryophylli]SMF63303.1 hopene-associated glycosyltransferase HpnB [Trinickia caryophylli]GLU33443.1 glycosyl transferase [Trinickia caryophylli]